VKTEADTSEAAEKVRIEIWRAMTPERKLRLMRDMTLAIQTLAFSELRQRYPDAPDDELWLRLAARRHSPETMRIVYGREIDPS
jgi:hypothetical protein